MTDIRITKGGTQLKDFLAALVSPLDYNGAIMKQFETDQTKHAKWNGRKIVLQAALNDLFAITIAPYIIIETNQSISTNGYFYEASEGSPVYFSETSENDPVYFYESSETIAVDYDFKVKVPVGIATAEVLRQVKAYTNLYKLAGPKFIIETY